MKKYLLIIGIASAMFAACSSSEDVLTQNGQDPIEEENISREQLMGNVPIEIAGASLGNNVEFEVEEITRSNANGVPENSQIGVFCLSAKKLDDNLGDSYFHWGDGTKRALNIWQDNTKVHINFTNGNSGNFIWDDPDVPHFYPKYDTFSYQFVAYQPYTGAIQYYKTYVYAWIPLDGDDDVIYAVSDKPRNGVVSDELAAYSYGNHYFSEIVRLNNESATPVEKPITADHKPYFTFNHLLAQVNFEIRLKDGAETSGRTFRVYSVAIRNLSNIGRLKLALCNGDGTIEDGGFTSYASTNSVPDNLKAYFDERGYTGKGNYYLREKDGSEISETMYNNDYKYILTSTKQPIGNGIFIPPASGNLTLDIYLCDNEGNRFTSSAPITVNKPSTGWKAGKRYTVPIAVTPPKYFMDETRGVVVNWVNDTEATVYEDIEAEF